MSGTGICKDNCIEFSYSFLPQIRDKNLFSVSGISAVDKHSAAVRKKYETGISGARIKEYDLQKLRSLSPHANPYESTYQ